MNGERSESSRSVTVFSQLVAKVEKVGLEVTEEQNGLVAGRLRSTSAVSRLEKAVKRDNGLE